MTAPNDIRNFMKAAAEPTRPSAHFEEQLVERLRQEVDQELQASQPTDLEVHHLAPLGDSLSGRPRGQMLMALAAAAVIIVFGMAIWLDFGGDDEPVIASESTAEPAPAPDLSALVTDFCAELQIARQNITFDATAAQDVGPDWVEAMTSFGELMKTQSQRLLEALSHQEFEDLDRVRNELTEHQQLLEGHMARVAAGDQWNERTTAARLGGDLEDIVGQLSDAGYGSCPDSN